MSVPFPHDLGLTLEERAEQAAENARCQRCEKRIMRDKSAEAMAFLRILVPGLGFKKAVQLCGRCGVDLREFLSPELADDPGFQATKQALLGEWT